MSEGVSLLLLLVVAALLSFSQPETIMGSIAKEPFWREYDPALFSQCQIYLHRYKDLPTTSTAPPPPPTTSAVATETTQPAPTSSSEESAEECIVVGFHSEWNAELVESSRCGREAVDESDVSLEDCQGRCEGRSECEAFQYNEKKMPRCVLWRGRSEEAGGVCAKRRSGHWQLFEAEKSCECRRLTPYRNGLMEGCRNRGMGRRSRWQCQDLCRRARWCKAAVYKWSRRASCVFYEESPTADASPCRLRFRSSPDFRTYTFLWLKKC